MREILEDAIITFRQEGENLLFIVAPAAVIGPIGAMIAFHSLTAAIVTIPLLVLLFFLTYAACLRAAGLMMENRTPEMGPAYGGVLESARDTIQFAWQGMAIISGAAIVSVLVSTLWRTDVALLLIAFAGGGFLIWSARHAYEQPFLLGLSVPGHEAQAAGQHLADRLSSWTAMLVVTLSAPMLVAGALAFGLSTAISASFGAAAFTMAVALWLPLPALALTAACARLVSENE